MKRFELEAEEGELPVLKIDGHELQTAISGFDLSMGVEGRSLTLYAVPRNSHLIAEVDVVHLVQPPLLGDALKLAADFLLEADPKEIEAIALDKLQWGGPKNMSHLTLAVIIEVLQNAGNEPDADSEVPGSPDGGLDSGGEGSGD